MAPADTSRGEAITAIVKSRETTNQQVLRLLEKMYDDLKPQQNSKSAAKLSMKEIQELVDNTPPGERGDVIAALAGISRKK